MIFHSIMNHLKMTVAGVGILMLTSCNGIFDDIYDQPKEIVPAKGQLLIDATSWTDWYYVDLNLLQRLTEESADGICGLPDSDDCHRREGRVGGGT